MKIGVCIPSRGGAQGFLFKKFSKGVGKKAEQNCCRTRERRKERLIEFQLLTI
jgi:hypothetical protein